MAKTAAASTVAKTNGSSIASLKEEGSRSFAMKEYEKAMAAWDKALGNAEVTKPDAALLHNNKAACHMVSKRFKEAVAECSAALESQPDYLKALVRRSKAYEQSGQYKQALADLQRANKLDGATDDTRAAERRVADLAAGKKPAGVGNGLGPRKPTATPARTAAPAAGGANNNRQVTIPVKLTMESDTRAFQLVPGITYTELMEHVRQLFPNAGPFVLKFTDKEGDLLTIASRSDINRAIQETVDSAGKSVAARIQAGNLPPIRMQAVKVASVEDVPKTPQDEAQYVQQMLDQLQRMQQVQAASKGGAAAAAAAAAAAPQQQIQVDEWILTFVDLLKEHCGLDPDRPLEAQEVGNERLSAGFTAMMQSDPKAMELLDAAHDKFQEQAAMGMVCQAQVHDAKATIITQRAAAEGKDAASVAEEVHALLDKAEAKVDDAIAYCPATLDAYLMKSQLEQGRAKIAANYLVEAVKPREDIQDAAERQAAEEAASKEAISKAVARVTADTAKAADPHMELAYAHIQAAIDAMPEAEKAKELKQLKPMAEQVNGDPESETPLKATLMINLGNTYYEHSILRAAGGLEWRELVLKAQKLFRDAGAAEGDIRNALKGHSMAAEMEDIIGPEPEPVVAKEETKTEEVKAEDAPKGLPSLGPRKKKEAA